jgi:hypothetical protein
MSVLTRYPSRLIVSAVLGNCAGFVGSASVCGAWAIASGEASRPGPPGPFYVPFLAIWFASAAWLVGLAYLIAVVPILVVVRRLAPPVYVAVTGLLLGAGPGLLGLLASLYEYGLDVSEATGYYLYASAALAHGVIGAVVTCWLAYFRWGREASNSRVQPTPASGRG